MHDGPHESLPMIKPWKELAKELELPSYEWSNLVELLEHAMSQSLQDIGFDELLAKLDTTVQKDVHIDKISRIVNEIENVRLKRGISSCLTTYNGKDGMSYDDQISVALLDFLRSELEGRLSDLKRHYLKKSVSSEHQKRLKLGIQQIVQRYSLEEFLQKLKTGDMNRKPKYNAKTGLDDGPNLNKS